MQYRAPAFTVRSASAYKPLHVYTHLLALAVCSSFALEEICQSVSSAGVAQANPLREIELFSTAAASQLGGLLERYNIIQYIDSVRVF